MKCIVRIYKLFLKFVDMLYDISSFFSWMNGINEGVVCFSFVSIFVLSLEGGYNFFLLMLSVNELFKFLI